MTARMNSNAPSTTIPIRRKGSRTSHTIGYRTKARMASGQQRSSKTTHRKNLVILVDTKKPGARIDRCQPFFTPASLSLK